MGYRIKMYGEGFNILGKYEGWHYGIWTDCMPKVFVFLKPVNKEDFVFCTLASTKDEDGIEYPNPFCGCMKLSWTSCIDGYFNEITQEEAQLLLDTKLNRFDGYMPKIGDIIYYCFGYDNSVHALEITGYDYRNDDIRLLYKSDTLFFGYNDSVSIKEYEIWWFKTKEEAEKVFQ